MNPKHSINPTAGYKSTHRVLNVQCVATNLLEAKWNRGETPFSWVKRYQLWKTTITLTIRMYEDTQYTLKVRPPQTTEPVEGTLIDNTQKLKRGYFYFGASTWVINVLMQRYWDYLRKARCYIKKMIYSDQ